MLRIICLSWNIFCINNLDVLWKLVSALEIRNKVISTFYSQFRLFSVTIVREKSKTKLLKHVFP